MRVVLISGPRGSGKATLASGAAGDRTAFLHLDDPAVLDAARSDPVGLIRGLDRVAICEIQRAPDLLLEIKASVDRDTRPGRFLLTSSADLMTAPRIADSLAGRMEVVDLLPLSRSEIAGSRSTFLDDMFNGRRPAPNDPVIGDDLVEAVLAGGYPEAAGLGSPAQRRDWYRSYIDTVVKRDVRDVTRVDRLSAMPGLLTALAERSGRLVSHSAIGRPLGMNHVTTKRYLGILETLFLVRRLRPWSNNRVRRPAKSPKLHFLDAGLLAALTEVSPDGLQDDRRAFGPLLETFVFAELQKIATWSRERCRLYHFRENDRHEVDIVVQNGRRRVVGIEVKASATVRSQDFSGLRRLAEAAGDRFVRGMVLYDHHQVVPFGDRMEAAPVSCLWSSA